MQSLEVGVGGVAELVDEAVVVNIDQLGDLVASESEETVFGVDRDGHGFEKAGGDAGPLGGGLRNVFDLPDVTVEGGEVGDAVFAESNVGGTDRANAGGWEVDGADGERGVLLGARIFDGVGVGKGGGGGLCFFGERREIGFMGLFSIRRETAEMGRG